MTWRRVLRTPLPLLEGVPQVLTSDVNNTDLDVAITVFVVALVAVPSFVLIVVVDFDAGMG